MQYVVYCVWTSNNVYSDQVQVKISSFKPSAITVEIISFQNEEKEKEQIENLIFY